MAQHNRLHVRAEIFGPFNTTRSVSPIVVIARAADPIFPGTARLDENHGHVGKMLRRVKRQRRLRIFFIGLTHANPKQSSLARH